MLLLFEELDNEQQLFVMNFIVQLNKLQLV